eukprot:1161578-Pelagomonas_calceolata.AAC.2
MSAHRARACSFKLRPPLFPPLQVEWNMLGTCLGTATVSNRISVWRSNFVGEFSIVSAIQGCSKVAAEGSEAEGMEEGGEEKEEGGEVDWSLSHHFLRRERVVQGLKAFDEAPSAPLGLELTAIVLHVCIFGLSFGPATGVPCKEWKGLLSCTCIRGQLS